MSAEFEDLLRRIPEIERRVRNMMRYVTVAEVDPAKGLVKLKDDGEDPDQTLETDWVPWMEQAGQTKTWTPPSVGQPMMLFSPSGNIADAIALAGRFSNQNAQPSQKGDENMQTIGGTTITVSGSKVHIKSGTIVLEGDVHLGGEGGKLVHRKGDLDSAGDAADQSATKVYAV
jgi:phage baseplate assembly protein gpV